MTSVIQIAVDDVTGDPLQPRKRFEKQALNDLAANIAEHGVLEPIIVRPSAGEVAESFIVIAGERRLRATRLAGLPTISAIVREDWSSTKVTEVAIAENTARQDLNAMEEARAFKGLLDENGGDFEAVARKAGRNERLVRERIILLDLTPDLQQAVEIGLLGGPSAVFVARLTPEYQGRALNALVKGDMTSVGFRLFCQKLEEEQAKVSVFGALPEDEQPKPVSSTAKRARAELTYAMDLAVATMGKFLDKKGDLVAEAINGDAALISQKLVLMEREARRLRTKIEAHAAANGVFIGKAGKGGKTVDVEALLDA